MFPSTEVTWSKGTAPAQGGQSWPGAGEVTAPPLMPDKYGPSPCPEKVLSNLCERNKNHKQANRSERGEKGRWGKARITPFLTVAWMYLRVHLIAAFPPPCLYPPTPSPDNLCGNWSELREILWEWTEYKEAHGAKCKSLGRGTRHRDTIRQMSWGRSAAGGDFQAEHIQPSIQTFPELWLSILFWEKLGIFKLEVLTKQWRWGLQKKSMSQRWQGGDMHDPHRWGYSWGPWTRHQWGGGNHLLVKLQNQHLENFGFLQGLLWENLFSVTQLP